MDIPVIVTGGCPAAMVNATVNLYPAEMVVSRTS